MPHPILRIDVKPLDDKLLRTLGPLALWAVATVFFNLTTLIEQTISPWRFIPYGIFTLYLTWFTVRALILWAQRRYPGLERTQQRLIWISLLGLPLTAVLVGSRLVLTRLWLFAGKAEGIGGDIPFMVGMGLFYLAIITSIYEARYFFRQWLTEKRASEELRRAKLEMQLSSLKNQVQPHFLFNSLNTLQALVKSGENPKAMRFIGDLAQVYRYLLQRNDQPLIPLEDELQFVHAYLNLLKTRFDEGLQLDLAINPAYRTYRLPPLTLQLLIENAVKHNVVSASRPLRIRIHSDSTETLVVENKLQRRPRSDVASDKKGLLTISQKYRLLGQPDVQIYETEQSFAVTVPLIKPD